MIKQCPFCGGSAAPRRASRDLHWVQCTGCGVASKLHDMPDQAAAVWNKRKDSSEEAFVAFLEREARQKARA